MSSAIRSSLIDPDGGALVDLVAPPDRRAALRAEAEALPRVRLAPVDVEWAHVLAEGWASPLRGFMREHEYLQCIHFNSLRLPSGAVVNMSLPIVLAIGDADKDRVGAAPDVALAGPDGELLAVLRRFRPFSSLPELLPWITVCARPFLHVYLRHVLTEHRLLLSCNKYLRKFARVYGSLRQKFSSVI
jgi:hypothetical protein